MGDNRKEEELSDIFWRGTVEVEEWRERERARRAVKDKGRGMGYEMCTAAVSNDPVQLLICAKYEEEVGSLK